MCQTCSACGAKFVGLEKCPTMLQIKLNPKNDPYAYEYCCLCPNGCPDQRPPPNNSDKCEMCCDCA